MPKSFAALQPLLVPIVTGAAKALPVAFIPEQHHVAFVRRDMVHHSCQGIAAGVRADRVELQPFLAGSFPLARIATLARAGPFSIMALVPRTDGRNPAGTARTMRHDCTTCAEMRRAAPVIFAFRARSPSQDQGQRRCSPAADRWSWSMRWYLRPLRHHEPL